MILDEKTWNAIRIGGGFPWMWLAVGLGVVASALIIIKKRKK